MSAVGQKERRTQNRLARLLEKQLGYAHLGNWEERPDNSNIEEGYLCDWLTRQGHDPKIIDRVIRQLRQVAVVSGPRSLYDANEAVYGLMRYGVKVAPDVGEQKDTIYLVDWEDPDKNDFAIAEEVTVAGENTKRPDIVLYLNGIAVGVIELKRSIVSVAEGIRQNLDSQKKEFIRPFFSTIQLVMAGNDTEGLRYGTIETPEKFFLTWKEPLDGVDNPLDRAVQQLCRKERLLELLHNFVVFDAGIKKICRHNQYFGVRAAQDFARRREGGIIWHTQGSGKSLTMVWLAKWIREHVTDPRVLLITDRTELDEQIEKVFLGVNEDIYRATSGEDLVNVLNDSKEPWLICSLIHKFGSSEEGDMDAFLEDIEAHLPKGFSAKGELFVFVDECHRTQSGKLHKAMEAILPGATFIGFTGTPLLKSDKKTTRELFGKYIHTYKYDEAVEDGVILDLRYEARDIDQTITSQSKIDQWFESKTKGLTDLARAQLKQRWGTMQQVLSSKGRLEQIVADVMFDIETRDRLKSGHGNAILVSGSIYQACRFFELFEEAGLKGHCAIITSYRPSPADIKGEEAGEGLTEKLRQYDIYRRMLADHFDEPEDAAAAKVELFEEQVKERFIKQPGQMKLLIVVDKLLTGFDAPPATYLYIDKEMHDHGLFQAICRVNRLDEEDKEYGYIIDYKDLFKSLDKAIREYTGGAFEGYDAADVAGLLTDRLEKGRERLTEVRESIKALCDPVAPPRDTEAYLRYFVGADPSDPELVKDNEPKRVQLYKLAAAFLRAYANLANEMADAGYPDAETAAIKAEVEHYEKVRQEVKLASADYIDMKLYEPAMRHLLDTYIRADESVTLSTFDDLSLVELLVQRGERALDDLPDGIKSNREAMAETIENNVRKVIIEENAVNPKYYDKMSELLDAVIRQRKQDAIVYETYLAKMVELAKKVKADGSDNAYPTNLTTAALRSFYDNLDQDAYLALRLDQAIRDVKKADWRGNKFKEKEVRNAIVDVVGGNDELAQKAFELAVAQREY